MSDAPYRTVTRADQVTQEMVDAVVEVVDGWYPQGQVKWDDVWDRVDGMELDDGALLDLGDKLGSPAMRELQRRVRQARVDD